MKTNYLIGITAASGALLGLFSFLGMFEEKIDFNAQVKPILNKHCMACHGGVKQAGGVSFLFEEDMYKAAKSGKPPVVAGNASRSEMMKRILLPEGHEDKMPKEGLPLAKEDVEILKKWINQGAKWGQHWAYKRVESPEIPKIGSFWARLGFDKNDEEMKWAKNEIDHFTLEKLREQNLKPAPEADRATLLRRVSLDLVGLPPTDVQVNRFLNDKSPKAYENWVDTLLASPRYGERWTGSWLDLARYADTKGYERDPGRSIWRYRDWLIKAFNEDKPYNQFITEQLAGDLLPQPTENQLIATGFHRNTMNNDEGGTKDEEFRVAAVIDRVNTTWEVFQGTTFGCVQCHSHPYDPIRHEEYYKFMAFFNNSRDEDITTDTPTLRFYETADSLRVQTIKTWIATHSPNPKIGQQQTANFEHFAKLIEPKINSNQFDKYVNAALLDAKYFGVLDGGSARVGSVTLSNKNRLLLAIGANFKTAVLQVWQDSLRGKLLATVPVPNTGNGWKDTVIIVPVNPNAGKRSVFVSLQSPKEPKNWVMIKWLAFQTALPGSNEANFANIEKAYSEILTGNVPDTPVMLEGTGDLARPTHVFVRGNMSIKGPRVQPDVPRSLVALPKNAPRNRLGLSQWMSNRDNPLTARVAVNRFWEQLFGTGIVETVEDFGSQGIAPTHQALLDWLAVELMENHQWSLKKLLKQIVLSATYRQSSAVSPEKLAKDSFNKWLSRGPRVRLSAEQIRDQVLSVSGLLSPKMFGPSVMPPQPDGIWLSPYGDEKWILSEGEDRYRRGIYTYWKRTAPYPSMVMFDAPSREFCQSRRIRTNTPLQALVTLNDPVYLEAAQQLAEQMAKKSTPATQISEGYRLLMHKNLPPKRLKVLAKLYEKSLAGYRKDPKAAQAFLAKNSKPTPEKVALTITANVLLNLDEVVTKE